MRSVYLQSYPKGSLKEQLRELDAVTIDEILADIIPTIRLQSHYESTLDGPQVMLDRPTFTSKKGTNGVRHSRVLM